MGAAHYLLGELGPLLPRPKQRGVEAPDEGRPSGEQQPCGEPPVEPERGRRLAAALPEPGRLLRLRLLLGASRPRAIPELKAFLRLGFFCGSAILARPEPEHRRQAALICEQT